MSWDLEIVEVEAMVDLWDAAPGHVREEHGVRCRRVGDGVALAVDALEGERMFNRVVGVRAADEGVLGTAADFYGQRPYFLALAPQAAGSDLLRSRGFEEDYAWMRFGRGIDRLQFHGGDLAIEEVGADRARVWTDVVLAAYGMPQWLGDWLEQIPGRNGWSAWAAFDGERAVGAGALFVHEHLGWFGFAGTLAQARGRGAQTGILAARIRAAAEAGCRVLATETGVRTGGDRPSNSYRNILRAGFEEAYERPNWRCPRRDSNPQPQD